MITIEDYRDWYEFSGLCLDLRVMFGPGPRRSAYLESLRENLSEAGFHALHVANTLWSYRLPINVDIYVTYCHPPEVPMLIADMQAIGATRWAAALIKGMERKEPPEFGAGQGSDLESPEELQALIRKYVKAHQSDLKGDMVRHGDPRQAPGFNRRKAKKVIEDRVDLYNLRGAEAERAVELAARLEELKELLQTHGAQPTDIGTRHRMRKLFNQIREDYKQRSREKTPIDAMTRWLSEAKDFIDRNAALFLKKPQADVCPAPVQARLAAIGPFQIEERGRRIVWENVGQLKLDFAAFDLVFEMDEDAERGRKPDLTPDDAMFDLWENYCKVHPTLAATFRKELIGHYRAYARFFSDTYESDEFPTDLPETEILGMVGDAQMTFRRMIHERKPVYETAVTFDIEWEDEHGFELVIDRDGKVVQPD